jgi:hypothetical protein
MWKQWVVGIVAMSLLAVSLIQADEGSELPPVTLAVMVDSPPVQRIAIGKEATVKFRAVVDAGDIDRSEAITKEADANNRFNWWVYLTPINADGTRGATTTYPLSGCYAGKKSRFTFAHAFTTPGKYQICASAELTGGHYAFSTSAEVSIEVVRADLQVIEAGASSPVVEADEEDPGGWTSVSAPASVKFCTAAVAGYSRTLTWTNEDKIRVIDVSTNAVVTSGGVVTEGEGEKVYQVVPVSAGARFESDFTMSVRKEDASFQDKVRVYTRNVTVKWVAASDSPLTTNTGPGGGKAIFPDRQKPSTEKGHADPNTHQWVSVVATVRPIPPVGTTIRFRSFDVDDPSTNPTINWNGVGVGSDNHGWPRGGHFKSATLVSAIADAETDAAGQAKVEFHVTFQPGDNFRIAADFFGATGLASLNDDNVPAGNDQLPNCSAGLTDMLTVWRRLWIEQDSMAALKGTDNIIISSGPPAQVTVNSPSPGLSTVRLGFNLVLSGFSTINQFEEGKITFGGLPAGSNVFVIYSSTANYTSGDSVVVIGVPGPGAIAPGTTFELVDDDDRTLLPHFPSAGAVGQNAFAKAYINLCYHPASRSIIPFNMNLFDLEQLVNASWTSGKQLETHQDSWCFLIVGCYQPEQRGDGDPDYQREIGPKPYTSPGEDPVVTKGVTPGGAWTRDSNECAAIFLETIRDCDAYSRNTTSMVPIIVSHEIAHALTPTHDVGGIFDHEPAPSDVDFMPETILRMRKTVTWGE